MIIGAANAQRHGLRGAFGARFVARAFVSQIVRRRTSRICDGLVGAAVMAAILGFTWSCANAAGKNSQGLRAAQTITTRVGATMSGLATTTTLDGVIGNAFASSPGGNVAATPSAADPVASAAAMRAKAQPDTSSVADPLLNGSWRAWAEVRGVGFESDTRTDGRQFNLTTGLDRMINADVLIGAFIGYQNFHYAMDPLSAGTTNDSVVIGGYAAWRFLENWRIDGKLGLDRVWYEGHRGKTEGSFDATRWLVGGGLTGIYRAGGFLVEPSSRVYTVWEDDDAYTDNLGAVQASRGFYDGRVATGAKIALPFRLSGFGLMPYAGAYADYRFSHDTRLPAGAGFAGLEDGWSARLVSGLVVRLTSDGPVITLGGEYGGIGGDSQRWGAGATMLWLF